MNIEAKAALRRAILRHLYQCQATAPYPVAALHIHIREARSVPCAFSEQDVAEALALLEGLGLVVPTTDPLGRLKSFALSADGILYAERNLIEE